MCPRLRNLLWWWIDTLPLRQHGRCSNIRPWFSDILCHPTLFGVYRFQNEELQDHSFFTLAKMVFFFNLKVYCVSVGPLTDFWRNFQNTSKRANFTWEICICARTCSCSWKLFCWKRHVLTFFLKKNLGKKLQILTGDINVFSTPCIESFNSESTKF